MNIDKVDYKEGLKVALRIVLKLNEYKYVLRIFGHNLVMQSKKIFIRFDKAELLIEPTSPILKTSIIRKINNSKVLKIQNQTDLTI